MARSPDMVLAELLSLPAEGWALPRETDSNWARTLRPLSTELARFEGEAEALLAEADPRAADDLLLEWERTFGLPDTCRPNESFTRASTATYIDGAGILRVADVNQPRFLYDAAGKVTPARILEAEATNLLRQSASLGTTPWNRSGTLTVTPAAAIGPAGSMTADLLTTTATSAGYASQDITIAAGGQYSLSWLLKAGTLGWCYFQISTISQSNGIRAWVNLAAASVGTRQVLGAGVIAAVSVVALADGWVRVSLTGTIDSSTTAARCWIIPCTANASNAQVIGGTIQADGAQAEAGGATSYIPTTVAPMTRAADVYRVATQAERRQRLVQQLTVAQGQTPAFFIALAASLGIPVTITEFRESTCESDCETPVYDTSWCFAWQVNAPLAINTTRDRTVEDDCETPLVTYGDNTLECLIRRLSPAHTTVLFAYG